VSENVSLTGMTFKKRGNPALIASTVWLAAKVVCVSAGIIDVLTRLQWFATCHASLGAWTGFSNLKAHSGGTSHRVMTQ
jgi:hypothetical protein